MAKKPNIGKALEWTSELLEEKILRALDISIKAKKEAALKIKTGAKLPQRHIRKKVKTWIERQSSLKAQIKELKRGLGGVILTNPEYYKKTGLFRMITENIGTPDVWTDDLSEGLVASIKKYGGAMTYTDQVNEFNPAGKVGHHRTALSALREAIEPLDVNVRAEFKKLAAADGYDVGEEFIDYLDPAAHKRFTKTISGALADKLGWTKMSEVPAKHQKLFAALAERSAHAAAFGDESGLFFPKQLIKEGASADEVYKYARPYLELSRRGSESGLQLDEIITSNRWNTPEELLEIVEKELPIQDTTPILNRMRKDLIDTGVYTDKGYRGEEIEFDVKPEGGGQFARGRTLVKDAGRSGISPEMMKKPGAMWYAPGEEVPLEAIENAKAIGARSRKANIFKNVDITSLAKVSTKLSNADSLAQIAGGNYLGGSIGLVMNSNAFRKAIAKRFAQANLKLIPGVGIGMSGLESAGYASQGRFTQAGIAALSGAVGELGPLGDVFSGILDIGNTTIDAFTGNLKPGLEVDEDDLGYLSRQVRKAA